MKRTGILRVGTSGLVLPGNKQSFPKAFRNKSRLCYYSTLFNSIEINSTFYKLPLPATVARWGTEVKPGFLFSVKMSRDITHVKNLAYNPEDIKRFMDTVNQSDMQKGCLLIQFPGKITADYFKQVNAILKQTAAGNVESRWKICVEFRHGSWYNAKTFSMLAKWKASVVLHDISKGAINTPGPETQVIYYRFHGPAGDYKGSYSPLQLKKYLVDIKASLKSGKDVYVYFNNTMGNAFANAQYVLKSVPVK
ncbi:MAG: DUF72 domain-containing protein [Chitinophagaceae bacterium]